MVTPARLVTELVHRIASARGIQIPAVCAARSGIVTVKAARHPAGGTLRVNILALAVPIWPPCLGTASAARCGKRKAVRRDLDG
jgi:hypothetical protein